MINIFQNYYEKADQEEDSPILKKQKSMKSNSNEQKSVIEIKDENPASSKLTVDTKSEETEKDEKVEKSLIKSVLETKPEDQKLDIDKEWTREKTLEEEANEALSFIAASEKGCESQNSIFDDTRNI